MTPKRVLIIDDEESIQTVVQFGLKIAAGWEVLVASSGREGIARAQADRPDTILLDVMMPEMDG
jgi:two-component system, OmpR family, alkaline phosphatase synthesis response regulator PhoP